MKKNNSKEIQHSDEDESGKICIGSTDKDRSIREKMMNECAEKQSLTTMIVRVWETNHVICE